MTWTWREDGPPERRAEAGIRSDGVMAWRYDDDGVRGWQAVASRTSASVLADLPSAWGRAEVEAVLAIVPDQRDRGAR